MVAETWEGAQAVASAAPEDQFASPPESDCLPMRLAWLCGRRARQEDQAISSSPQTASLRPTPLSGTSCRRSRSHESSPKLLGTVSQARETLPAAFGSSLGVLKTSISFSKSVTSKEREELLTLCDHDPEAVHWAVGMGHAPGSSLVSVQTGLFAS